MNDITPKEAIANLNHIYGMVAPDIQRSLDVAIKALEEKEWIPVSERLPEKKGWYEATFISVTGARTVALAFYSDRIEDFAVAVDGVIAWKPLPEPYKENGK